MKRELLCLVCVCVSISVHAQQVTIDAKDVLSTNRETVTDYSGRIHAVWSELVDRDFEVFYERSNPSGESIKKLLRITNSQGISCLCKVLVDSRCNVHIFWLDDRDASPLSGMFELYYTQLLEDGSARFNQSRITKVTENSQDSHVVRFDLAVDSRDVVHLAWIESRGTHQEVFYWSFDHNGNPRGTNQIISKGDWTSNYSSLQVKLSVSNINIIYLKHHDNVTNAFLSELSYDGVLTAREVQLTYFKNDAKKENKQETQVTASSSSTSNTKNAVCSCSGNSDLSGVGAKNPLAHPAHPIFDPRFINVTGDTMQGDLLFKDKASLKLTAGDILMQGGTIRGVSEIEGGSPLVLRGPGGIIQQAFPGIIFQTGPTAGTLEERMRITGTGQIGVGTTTPLAGVILDVNGNVRVVGNITIQGNVAITGTITTPSVNSASIVDGSIQNADLATNSVDSSKIVDGSVQSADIADGTIQIADIAPGTVPTFADQEVVLTETSPIVQWWADWFTEVITFRVNFDNIHGQFISFICRLDSYWGNEMAARFLIDGREIGTVSTTLLGEWLTGRKQLWGSPTALLGATKPQGIHDIEVQLRSSGGAISDIVIQIGKGPVDPPEVAGSEESASPTSLADDK